MRHKKKSSMIKKLRMVPAISTSVPRDSFSPSYLHRLQQEKRIRISYEYGKLRCAKWIKKPYHFCLSILYFFSFLITTLYVRALINEYYLEKIILENDKSEIKNG
ncbi:MAG: hypothetical protein ACYCQI_04615 [Gammaproteobacteria bacterium]